MRPGVMTPRAVLAWIAVPVLTLTLTACDHADAPADRTPSASTSAPQTAPPAPARAERGPIRDLASDESLGGHTLSRHVGKTDAELADRLRREPRISAASTYTDRATAERSVGSALASGRDKLAAWERRSGRRPNLVLNYRSTGKEPLGRSLRRGQKRPTPATRALVVLRWDERARRFYVLTSYPEAER
jgi:hypothetical protein